MPFGIVQDLRLSGQLFGIMQVRARAQIAPDQYEKPAKLLTLSPLRQAFRHGGLGRFFIGFLLHYRRIKGENSPWSS